MRLSYFFLFFFITTLIFGQSSEIDSLKSVLNHTPEGKTKIDLLIKLARSYQNYSLTDLEHYANEAYSLADKGGYENSKADASNLLSVYYALTGDHNRALEQQLRALQIFEKLNDRPNIAKALHNRGGLYFLVNEYDNAIKLFLQSIAIKKELKDTLNAGVSEMAVCVCYNSKNQPDSAKAYCDEALAIMKTFKIPGRLAEAYLYSARNFTLRKQYAEAGKAYRQTIQIVENGKLNGIAVELYNDLGSYYLDLGKYDSAAISIHKTLRLLRMYDNQSSVILAYELLAKKHELTHRYDSALYFYKLYSKENDESFNTQKSKQIASLQAQYDLKNKDKEIELNKQSLKLQMYIISAISIILLISLILGYIIFRVYLARTRANQKLQLLNNSIQEKNEEITVQSEELRQANDEIVRMNENLESLVKERMKKIENQNKKLVEYAYFNAHKVRGPLARILGLINLIKRFKFDGEVKDIHDRIDESAQELDHVIHEINSNLERDNDTGESSPA